MHLFREQIRELVSREARPSHKFGHQERLYRLALQVGAGMAYDDDVVFAAVWLHDLGVFEGNRPADPGALAQWDHVTYAVRRTEALLPSLGVSSATVQRVVQAIREHQPHDTPTSPESTIVRDADILEQLGSIAVLRTAAKLGSDTRFTAFGDVAIYLERQLRSLPGMLLLETSRALALPRAEALENFLAAYQAETTE